MVGRETLPTDDDRLRISGTYLVVTVSAVVPGPVSGAAPGHIGI
jgi:hypothetical protein